MNPLYSCQLRASVLLLLVVLTGCQSTPAPQSAAGSASAPSAGGRRYTLENDVPLIEPIDLDAIREVTPKVEKRTAAGNKNPYTINGKTYRLITDERGYSEVGIASWYGRKFHGHLTANGEQYDMFQLTAAHTTLPIPSYIRVTNLDNGKSVLARVNDRGPFHPGRIVDMSYAGAVLLGYANAGTARVRVESVLPGDESARGVSAQAAAPVVTAVAAPQMETAPLQVLPPDSQETLASERLLIEADQGSDYLQVGAFAAENSALALQKRLQAMTSLPVVIHQELAVNGSMLFKVRVGPLADDNTTKTLQDAVTAARLGTPFKVRR